MAWSEMVRNERKTLLTLDISMIKEGVNGGLLYSELGLYILFNSELGAIILPIS